ncbi:MAG: hypothetical protein JWN10_922 [Solirubrobacterales bacterium]|nr:hypothetical protein [Solirubrobacterales bacterium]
MKPPPVIYRNAHDGLTEAQREVRTRPLTKTKAEREAARARLREQIRARERTVV